MIFKEKSNSDILAKAIRLIISDNDGTLTPGHTFYSANGEILKQYHHRDGRGIFLLKKNNLMFGIITGEDSEIVLRRGEKLSVDFVELGISNKKKVLNKVLKKYNLNQNEVAYIGDDTNDIEIMKEVGMSFAVFDSHPEVIKMADVWCSKPGGFGAVREVIDYILEIQSGCI